MPILELNFGLHFWTEEEGGDEMGGGSNG